MKVTKKSNFDENQEKKNRQGKEMEYVKVQVLNEWRSNCGAVYIDEIQNIDCIALMDGCPPGDGYVLTKIEMTEDEFKALPEFTGF